MNFVNLLKSVLLRFFPHLRNLYLLVPWRTSWKGSIVKAQLSYVWLLDNRMPEVLTVGNLILFNCVDEGSVANILEAQGWIM
jgi:hypothetical protein